MAIEQAGRSLARRWEETHRPEGLRRFDPEAASLGCTDDGFHPEPEQLRGGSVLLLLHGPLSTTASGFCDLRGLGLARLSERYEGRVLGYDHFTLSKSPEENAAGLVAALAPAPRPAGHAGRHRAQPWRVGRPQAGGAGPRSGASHHARQRLVGRVAEPRDAGLRHPEPRPLRGPHDQPPLVAAPRGRGRRGGRCPGRRADTCSSRLPPDCQESPPWTRRLGRSTPPRSRTRCDSSGSPRSTHRSGARPWPTGRSISWPVLSFVAPTTSSCPRARSSGPVTTR